MNGAVVGGFYLTAVEGKEGGVAGENVHGVFGDANEKTALGGLQGLSGECAGNNAVFLAFHGLDSGERDV